MKYRINVGVTTAKGPYRSNNEDNFLFDDNYLRNSEEEMSISGKCNIPMLFALCDGIGGYSHSREASKIAIDILNRNRDWMNGADNARIAQDLDLLIKKANAGVYSLEEQGKKAGCTLALTYIRRDRIYIANVGDSRIYRLTEDGFMQLSADHNQEQDMARFGLIQDGKSSRRNVLTQFIGMSPKEIIIEPHYDSYEYGNMIFLLCSDGLSEALSLDDMEAIIKKYRNRNLKKATNCLVSKAMKQGSKDNLTAMLIKLY